MQLHGVHAIRPIEKTISDWCVCVCSEREKSPQSPSRLTSSPSYSFDKIISNTAHCL